MLQLVGNVICIFFCRFCLRHICSNLFKKCKNQTLKDLAYIVGKQFDTTGYDRVMSEIKKLKPEAHDWLMRINPAMWSRAHDGGHRYGVLTTNASECFNGVLKGARRLPICTLVQTTFDRSVEYFMKRRDITIGMRAAGNDWPNKLTEAFQKTERE